VGAVEEGVTVTVLVSAFPPLVATMYVTPIARPVTTPEAVTVATLGLRLENPMVIPDTGLPEASWAVAVSCAVLPAARLMLAGDSVTELTVELLGLPLLVPPP
jgi:hypothetical protein